VSAPTAEPKKQTAPGLTALSLYAASANEKTPPPLAMIMRVWPADSVRAGHHVDSSTIDTPIVGLVTDDVWHAGKLIIPAGAEVHGMARVDHTRERIAAAAIGRWYGRPARN